VNEDSQELKEYFCSISFNRPVFYSTFLINIYETRLINILQN